MNLVPTPPAFPADCLMSVAVISTGHVSETTGVNLTALLDSFEDRERVDNWIIPYAFGWIVNLAAMRLKVEDDRAAAWLAFAEFFDAETIPNLEALLASEVDCVWFRSTADCVEGLEVFEW